MPEFRLLQSEVKPLTLELATAFRDLEPSPTERDLNPSRLKMLRDKAENGLLITFHWAKARMGGKWLRVNGQHSATMLAELNGAFPDGLRVHLDEYEVDGPKGLAALFRQFDDRKSGRTAADVAGAYQNLEPALRDVPKPIGKIGVEGVAWFNRHVEGVPVAPGDGQYHLFNEPPLHIYLRWLGEVFSIKTPELKRVPVLAAMYATFVANEGEARKFWDQVARGGAEYEDNAATTVLDNWLKAAKEGEDDKLKPAQYYQGCIYAYNAYREGKSIKDIKCDTRKAMLKPHAD